ncbi:PAS domain S-box protein [Pedobacter nyackensis]|nr:PAS domain S-box protein [Pedobacter nyackensis]
MQKRQEHEILKHELDEVESRFKDILNHSISSANTFSILYKQYGNIDSFDEIARDIMEHNKGIDFMNFAENYTITHVYPLQGNQKILGHSLLEVPLFRKEIEIAIKSNKVLFAGPYRLTQGRGIGISCRIPIIINNKYKGLASVITKLPTVFSLLPQLKNNGGKFVYQLSKVNPVTLKSESFFPNYVPKANSGISVYMPEGNWTLHAAYSSLYTTSNDVYAISVLGILLSFSISIVVYHRAKLPVKLERIIQSKTRELAGSEKYYRRLIESSTDVIALFNAAGQAIYRTPSFEKVTGYTVAEMQNASDIDLVDPEHKDQDRLDFVKVASIPGSTLFKRHKLRHKQGHYIYVDGIYRNMLEDDNVKAVVYTYSDVTDKVLALHDLGERVKELSTIFKLNEILKDTSQDIDSLFEKIVNLIREGWQYPEYCEAKIEFDGKKYITAGYHSSPYSQVASFSLVDGKYGLVEVIYTKEKPKAFEGSFLKEERDLINTIADTITIYLNKAIQQRNLIESQKKFQDLVEKSLVGVYIIIDDALVYVNPKVVEDIGYTEEEMYLLTIRELVHEEDYDMVSHNMSLRMQGINKSYETRVKRKDGSYIWIEVFGNNTTYQGKKALIGTMVNITGRKNLELERQGIIHDLEQRNRDLEQFSNVLSHNIRSPISTVLGLISLLDQEMNEEDIAIALRGIDQSVKKLDDVVKDLNEILRIRNSLSNVNSRVVFKEILDETRKTLADAIEKKNVLIEYDFTAIPDLNSVRAYIKSIFCNVISNGIKYSRPGVVPHLLIRSSKSDDKVFISFKDNGIGIDLVKYKDQIFGLYKRFHPSIEGKGLGLYIVKTQATALNGNIEVRSTLEQGSEFILSFSLC